MGIMYTFPRKSWLRVGFPPISLRRCTSVPPVFGCIGDMDGYRGRELLYITRNRWTMQNTSVICKWMNKE